MRWIAIGVMSACLMMPPAQSQAGVLNLIEKCATSMKMIITCVVIERGLEKILDVALGDLIDYAFGRKKTIEGEETKASTQDIADIRAGGIEWPTLRDFLVSTFGSAKPADNAQVRAAVSASCEAKYSAICKELGIAAPHPTLEYCARITAQKDCESSMLCSWKGNHCSHSAGGT
jgi:hypothetical protein